jgi:hypothetical protein
VSTQRLSSLFLAASLGCSASPTPPADPESQRVLAFAFDAPVGGEAYQCSGFDASGVADKWIRGIAWTSDDSGGAVLHHAALYAVPEVYAAGPVPCDAMPTSWTLHVWAPGGAPLALPAGVALTLPPGTRSLVVQTHALRFSAGPPSKGSASLDVTSTAPVHAAAWLPAFGSVPAIRPHMQEHTATTCRAAAPMHIFTAWPHMHLLGTAFEGAIVRADGTRTTMVDVPSWDFDEQHTYGVDMDVAAGDGIETDCTWYNPTDEYVLPGTATTDEMCGDGLIVWPAAAAAWQGTCQ